MSTSEHDTDGVSDARVSTDPPGSRIDEDLLTITEAAQACGVARSTMRRFVTNDRFPNARRSTHNGDRRGIWRIPRADLADAGLLPNGGPNGSDEVPTSSATPEEVDGSADPGPAGNARAGDARADDRDDEDAPVAAVDPPELTRPSAVAGPADVSTAELTVEVSRLHQELRLSEALNEERVRTIDELRLALHALQADLESEIRPRRRSRRARNVTFFVLIAVVLAGLYAITRLGADSPPDVAVPDLVSGNPPLQEIERVPTELGLESEIELAESADLVPGRVVDQTPRPGVRLEEGAVVTIIVSAGSGATEVPAVQGLPIDQARDALLLAGVDISGEPELETSSEDSGTVLRTDPEPGTSLRRGDKVTVVVSGGEDE